MCKKLYSLIPEMKALFSLFVCENSGSHLAQYLATQLSIIYYLKMLQQSLASLILNVYALVVVVG